MIFTFLEYRFQTKAQNARRRIEKVTAQVNNRHTPGADSFASAQVALGLGKTFAFQSPILCLALQLAEVYVGCGSADDWKL